MKRNRKSGWRWLGVAACSALGAMTIPVIAERAAAPQEPTTAPTATVNPPPLAVSTTAERASEKEQRQSAGSAVRSITTAREDIGFQVTVPEKWDFSNQGFAEGGHYSDIVEFVVDNKRVGATGYRFESKPLEGGGAERLEEFSLSQLSQQMSQGEIRLTFARRDSFFFARGAPPIDTVGSDLRSLLSTAILHPAEEPGMTSFKFSFEKRGIRWNVQAYAKGAIGENDKKDLDALLQSLKFIDGPVAGDQWAAYLAWQQLPAEERKPDICWIIPHGQCGYRLVEVTRAEAGYLVTFKNSEPEKSATWKFRVEGLGKVTPIP